MKRRAARWFPVFVVAAMACGRAAGTTSRDGGPSSPSDATAREAGARDGGELESESGGSDATDAAPAPAPGPLPAPTNHRPVATPCSSTRPPSMPNDAGPDASPSPQGFCYADSQCRPIDGGTNGRCVALPVQEGLCTYDACTVDSDCTGGAVCECGIPYTGQGRFPNVCVGGGNCKIDGECGDAGYCSPSYGPCGAEGIGENNVGQPPLTGYYCHTPYDECTNDDECPAGPDSAAGFCAWDSFLAHWACTVVDLSQCTG